MATKKATEDLSKLSYEELVEKLEELINQMSSSSVGIEAVSGLYEQAGIVYAEAEQRLNLIREKIENLTAHVEESADDEDDEDDEDDDE